MTAEFFSPETDPRLFQCGCGREDCPAPPPRPGLLDALDRIRRRLGRPVVVTSGPRCPDYNARVGGAPDSAHLDGDAADLACPSSAARYALVAAATQEVDRIGVGTSFVHVDVGPRRPRPALWLYRQ